LTQDTGLTTTITTEFGVGLAATAIIITVFFGATSRRPAGDSFQDTFTKEEL
jgi:hypothetical protein